MTATATFTWTRTCRLWSTSVGRLLRVLRRDLAVSEGRCGFHVSCARKSRRTISNSRWHSVRIKRQAKRKNRPTSRLTDDSDIPPVRFDDNLGDGESHPGAGCRVALVLSAVKLLKDQ